MFPVKRLAFFSIATGLAVTAFAVVATKTSIQQAVFAIDTPFSLPQQQRRLILNQSQLIAQKQRKIALVIGNADYEEGRLSNPVNDATDVAKALRELGFEVTLLQNQDLQAMEKEVENFSQLLRNSKVGVFYYAGHGVQVEGENYLIPLKAKLIHEKDARYEAVALGKVLNAMEAAENQVNIVIIDACRDNPFYRRWYSRRRGSNVRGLTAVSPPNGIIIAYATREGNTAEDGIGERNSPFTSALLENIKTADLDIQLMFRRVSTSVRQKTGRRQEPWVEGNLEGDEFYLNPTAQITPPIEITTPIVTNSPSPKPTPKPSIAAVPTPTPSNPFSELRFNPKVEITPPIVTNSPSPQSTPKPSIAVVPKPTPSNPFSKLRFNPTIEITTPIVTNSPSPQPTPKPSIAVAPTPTPSNPFSQLRLRLSNPLSELRLSNPSNQQRSTLISSTTGVDYTPLRELLSQKKWKEADRKTWDLMLAAANRQKEGYLDTASVNTFSCEDLRIIDQEWLKASGGKFGFSVQLRIFKQTGNTPGSHNEKTSRSFADAVGWSVGSYWNVGSYDNLGTNALATAPQGNIPKEWMKWEYDPSYPYLFVRLVNCSI